MTDPRGAKPGRKIKAPPLASRARGCARGFTALRRSRPPQSKLGRCSRGHWGLDQDRMEASFPIIHPTSRHKRTGTCRTDKGGKTVRKNRRGRGKVSANGSLSPPRGSPLGSAWLQDDPWAGPLARPLHRGRHPGGLGEGSPPPEQSWLRIGRLELARRLSAVGTGDRFPAGRPGSPAHRRPTGREGRPGALLCLPAVGGNQLPPWGPRFSSTRCPSTVLPVFSPSLLVPVCAWFRALLGSKPERVCAGSHWGVGPPLLKVSSRINKNCPEGVNPGHRQGGPTWCGPRQFPLWPPFMKGVLPALGTPFSEI